MTDRKLKRLLAEKPFLIDDNFSMTGGEAELMLMENGPLSIEDMLVKARQKDGWKPEFEQMINRILANTPLARWNRLRVNLQTGLQHTWAFHAKAVVTWVIILLLTVMMVFTPVGKAVAESITRFIVDIRDGFILIQTMSDDSEIKEYISNDNLLFTEIESNSEKYPAPDITEKEYASFEEFIIETGLHPVCLQADDYKLSRILFYDMYGVVRLLETTYNSDDNVRILLKQEWSTDNEKKIIKNDYDVVLQTTVLDGAQLIGYYDKVNYEFYATILLSDSVLEICYAGEPDYNMILQSLVLR